MYFLIHSFYYILFSLILVSLGLFFKNFFFKNADLTIGEIGIYGVIFLYFIILVYHFFLPISAYFILIVWILALLNLFFYTKELKFLIKKNNYFIILFILFLIISLSSSTHDDINLYQFQIINYMQNFKIIFGISSLNDYLGYGHSFYEVMSFFHVPIYKNNFVFLIPVIFAFFFIEILFQKISKNNIQIIHFFIGVILTFFFLKFTRSKEYGTDIVVFSCLSLIQIYFLEFLLNEKKNIYIKKIFIIFSFSIFCKLYSALSIFYLIFPLIFLLKDLIKQKKNYFLITFLFFFCFFGVIKNIINTGCIFYPIGQTCFDQKVLPWSVSSKIAEKRNTFLSASSKGLKAYIRSTDGTKKVTAKDYLEISKYNYPKYLTKDPDFERFLILIGVILLSFLILFFEKNENKEKSLKLLDLKSSKYKLLIFISLIPVIGWFMYIPHLRYGGYNYITFFCILVLYSFFYNKNLKIKKLNFLIILSLLFCFGKNIKRIHNEIKKNEEFPKIVFDKIIHDQIYINNFKIHYPKNSLYCGNISHICASKKNMLHKMYQKYGYIILIPDRRALSDFISDTENFENYLLNDIKKL